jgi:hypothetical protein
MTELRHSRELTRHNRYRYINKRKRLARMLNWFIPYDGRFNKEKTSCSCGLCGDVKYRDKPREKLVRDWEDEYGMGH